MVRLLTRVPGGAGAKGDEVAGGCGGGAGEGGRGVVVGVAVRPGARVLEELGVLRRPACAGAPELAVAAIPRRSERLARAPARHPLAVDRYFKIGRAQAVEVDQAPGGPARAGGGPRGLGDHEDGEVVAVDEADVEEVEPGGAADGELREGGGRGGSSAGALDVAGAAVGAGAGEAAGGGVGGAESAGPETTRPKGGGGLEGAGLPGGQREAGGGQRR